MMRRTPLKRTGFKPRTPLHKSVPNREQALMERTRAAMKNVAPRAAVMGGACTGVAVPKAAPVRSEAYRRAVAGLPYHNQPQRFADKRLMLSILNQRSKV